METIGKAPQGPKPPKPPDRIPYTKPDPSPKTLNP